MEVTLSKIAALVQGTIIGDPEQVISGVAPFALAAGDQITVAGTARFLKKIGDCTAGAILVPRDFKTESIF